jgi:predicted DNA-binding transcriptional regulator AlpA
VSVASPSPPAATAGHADRLADRFVVARDVAAMFGYRSPKSLMNAVKDKRFPPPIRLAHNRCVWPASVLVEHMERLKAGGDAHAAV